MAGLNRIAQAETNEDWGTGIDQLNEVAKALLFRGIELTEDQKTRMKQLHESFGERTKSLHEQAYAARSSR